MVNTLRLGDVLGVSGVPFRTKAGELSVKSKEALILSPCLHHIPHLYYGLKNKVFLNEYIDYLGKDI